MVDLIILKISTHPTVDFAARELSKYLSKIIGREVPLYSENKEHKQVIRVGISDDFNGIHIPEVNNKYFDDAICIRMDCGNGVICGNQPRSVLLAVYRYLTEIGCRFLQPGIEGEILCSKEDIFNKKVFLTEIPSYRHRGVCIEGAVSREVLLNMIDWLPKVGCNSYFIQFREAYDFFARWYNHSMNPFKETEGFTVEMARNIVSDAIEAIRLRGLIFHAVGHGWTTEIFGIQGLGWFKVEEAPECIRKYLAEINGEQKYFKDIPINTNLCYSNPEVRTMITDCITNYAIQNEHIDVLHFWLADDKNNNCECPDCRDIRPSDFYVQMLNELDRKMTDRGLKTRIVFLVYVDLLWSPEHMQFVNPDRFILMFAPITRTFALPFTTAKISESIPEFQRNKLKFPQDASENIAFLQKWQKIFKGDSFIFDYHYLWAHVFDPGYFKIAEILHYDIQNLCSLNLNGYISCQAQKAFFPNGLGMASLGRVLWDREIVFDGISEDYFQYAYGHDWKLAMEYFKSLSDLFQPFSLNLSNLKSNMYSINILNAIINEINKFLPVIDRNSESGMPIQKSLWAYAKIHADMWLSIIRIFVEYLNNDIVNVKNTWQKLKLEIARNEDAVVNGMDVWNTIVALQNWLRRYIFSNKE